MGILAWIVLGLVAGALAKFIMPGQQGGGIILTIVLGVVGALVGGFLGTYVFGFGDISGSISAASRSRSVEPYWCCSCTGSSLAAAPNHGCSGPGPPWTNTQRFVSPNGRNRWLMGEIGGRSDGRDATCPVTSC